MISMQAKRSHPLGLVFLAQVAASGLRWQVLFLLPPRLFLMAFRVHGWLCLSKKLVEATLGMP